MVLDTLGKEVNIDKLISKLPPESKGVFLSKLPSLLKDEGVNAVYWTGRNVSDLNRYTSKGTPVIVRITDDTGKFSHAVVVDGVTKRNGIDVVAIRDPHGKQYFSPVETFKKHFTGEVVVPKK